MELKLAENIRSFRKARGLTQEQLAEALMVSVGAVSKWEKGASVPDISLIMELADFFETSVDVLLGYGWQKRSMGQTAEHLKALYLAKKTDEGIAEAEKALQKFPNSFQIVYQSAMLYFTSLNEAHAPRAIALFQRALELIDQNIDERISPVKIQNRIASCYLILGQYEKSIELLKKNNFDGLNDADIGLILAGNCRRFEEALPYLSDALERCQNSLIRICIGFANAYGNTGREEKALSIMLWMLELNRGLKIPGTVAFMDKADATLWAACAEAAWKLGDPEQALEYLKQAYDTARKFDANPEYGMNNLKYYHGNSNATVFDDLGNTAMEAVENQLHEKDGGGLPLLPIWKELCDEA